MARQQNLGGNMPFWQALFSKRSLRCRHLYTKEYCSSIKVWQPRRNMPVFQRKSLKFYRFNNSTMPDVTIEGLTFLTCFSAWHTLHLISFSPCWMCHRFSGTVGSKFWKLTSTVVRMGLNTEFGPSSTSEFCSTSPSWFLKLSGWSRSEHVRLPTKSVTALASRPGPTSPASKSSTSSSRHWSSCPLLSSSFQRSQSPRSISF